MSQPLRRIDPADTQALLDRLLARSSKVAPPVTLMSASEVDCASSIARHLGPEALRAINTANYAPKPTAPVAAKSTEPASVQFDRLVAKDLGTVDATGCRDLNDLIMKDIA